MAGRWALRMRAGVLSYMPKQTVTSQPAMPFLRISGGHFCMIPLLGARIRQRRQQLAMAQQELAEIGRKPVIHCADIGKVAMLLVEDFG